MARQRRKEPGRNEAAHAIRAERGQQKRIRDSILGTIQDPRREGLAPSPGKLRDSEGQRRQSKAHEVPGPGRGAPLEKELPDGFVPVRRGENILSGRGRGPGRPRNASTDQFWTRVGICAEVITALSKRVVKRRRWLSIRDPREADRRRKSLRRELLHVFAATMADSWQRFGIRDPNLLRLRALTTGGARATVRWVTQQHENYIDPAYDLPPRNFHTRLALRWLREQRFVQVEEKHGDLGRSLSLKDVAYGKKYLRERHPIVAFVRRRSG